MRVDHQRAEEYLFLLTERMRREVNVVGLGIFLQICICSQNDMRKRLKTVLSLHHFHVRTIRIFLYLAFASDSFSFFRGKRRA